MSSLCRVCCTTRYKGVVRKQSPIISIIISHLHTMAINEKLMWHSDYITYTERCGNCTCKARVIHAFCSSVGIQQISHTKYTPRLLRITTTVSPSSNRLIKSKTHIGSGGQRKYTGNRKPLPEDCFQGASAAICCAHVTCSSPKNWEQHLK